MLSFRESLLNEFDGHLESGSLGVLVDVSSVDLGLLDQVLDESHPFLSFVTRASVRSAAVSTESTRSSAVVVSRESFLHVLGLANHVEGVVISVVVVSDSVHV